MKHIKIQILTAVLATLTLLVLTGSGAAAMTDASGGASTGVTPAPSLCHPENNKPPGQALTAEQLKSCQACKSADINNCLKGNPIVSDLQTIVDVLSAGVGIVVVAMIIVGGIQYSIAGDNPQKLTAAKMRITNALIALVAFMFLFAFVQWLIPGGIFG